MRLYNTKGRLVSKNVRKYLIDWDKKCRSKVQFKVKKILEPYWKNHVVYEEFPVYGTLLKVDILNATKKIAVEVQGKQHNSYNPFFHKKSRAKYLESLKRDVLKAEWLEKNSFKLIEVDEEEVPHIFQDYILNNPQKIL